VYADERFHDGTRTLRTVLGQRTVGRAESVVELDPLSDRDRDRLQRRAGSARGTARAMRAAQIVLLLDDGYSPTAVSDVLHVPIDQVARTTEGHRRSIVRRRFVLATLRRVGAFLRHPVTVDLSVLALVATALFLPLADNLAEGRTVIGNNDLAWLIPHSVHFDLFPPNPPSPHFLFPLMLRLVYLALGLAGPGVAVVLVLVGIRIAAGSAFYLVLRGVFDAGSDGRLGRRAAVAGSIIMLLVESPRIFFNHTSTPRGDAFLSLQTLFNPTGMALVPFAVIGAALIVTFVDRARAGELTAARRASVAIMAVLATLAKPSFAAAFLPAIPLWALLVSGGGPVSRWRVLRAVGAWIVLPLVAVTAWQLWWSAQPERVFGHGGSSTLTFDPLVAARAWGVGRPLMWLALAVPIVGVVLRGPSWLWSRRVALPALAALIALAQFLLFAETGERATDGNLGWGVQIAVVLISVEAVRELLRSRSEGTRSPWFAAGRSGLAAALVATCVVSGAIVVVSDGWRNSPCLDGDVTVERLTPAGSMVPRVECA
jgi:hypothetical protein